MSSFPEDGAITITDKHGLTTILVRAHHLTDFPGFVAWMSTTLKGRHRGLVRLRLFEEDRRNDEVYTAVMSLMRKVFDRQTYDRKTKSKDFEYQPDAQVAYRTSPDQDIFQYRKVPCSPEERQNKLLTELYFLFSLRVLKESGVTGLAERCFSVLRELDSSRKNDAEICAILYGAGIQLHRGIKIKLCKDFSLSHLKTVLDHLPQKYDGLAYPYVYSGTAEGYLTSFRGVH
ncbi:Claudin-34 [Frankliniella fusca]|uniref:Claudin-34 n=1 Tax=Frankliniella fusca TaxID=407009 RepID=A0AAE1HWR3_9NEOP|nr:Claudin-34 [Frankliniella fusca]